MAGILLKRKCDPECAGTVSWDVMLQRGGSVQTRVARSDGFEGTLSRGGSFPVVLEEAKYGTRGVKSAFLTPKLSQGGTRGTVLRGSHKDFPSLLATAQSGREDAGGCHPLALDRKSSKRHIVQVFKSW